MLNTTSAMTTGPRVCILYEFRSGPWGGGNQFLKALRGQIEARGTLETDPERADVVIVNSHHRLAAAARIKRRRPGITVIHRIDGPIGLIRARDHEVDRVLYRFNRAIASGTIFQSDWSRRANLDAGMVGAGESTVIVNAPDPALFHRDGKAPYDGSRRLRLIATSWSPNPRKGFDVYAELDRALDGSRFEMTFVGNSPVNFRNIRMLAPLPSAELADELRRHDIFVTASRSDPCSNSLLEALHCGLPALALRDGGHPELVGAGGETFADGADALAKLDRIAERYDHYRAAISVPTLAEVTEAYVDFATEVHADTSRDAVRPAGAMAAQIAAAALERGLTKRGLRLASALSGGRVP